MAYLPELFEAIAKAKSASVAVIEDARQWTFEQLIDDINRIASVLKERVTGDVVGILLLNSQQYVATLFAIWKAGKVAVPLNYLLPPADLGFIIRDSGMSGLVSSEFFNQALGAIKPLFGDGAVIMADDPAFLAPAADAPAAAYREPAVYLYTSGTTGRPKGVILTHDNLSSNVLSCQKAGDFDDRDGFLCLLPFFHTYAITGTVLLPLLSGSRIVLVDRFQPAKVLGLIQEHKISVFLAIPSMYRVLAAAEGDYDLSCVRFPISGGEPLPVAVAEAFEKRFNVPIYEGYGQTEAAPVVTLNTPGHRKLGTIGRALPGIQVAIWDDQNRVLPPGEIGEIMVRGSNVMKGYHRQPEETARTITDGWLHTGDMGKVDEDGFVTITGRKKDLIISAGENIYPREIEDVLSQHPKVKEVAVIGVEDDVRGEVPKAFVIVRDGVTLEEKELRSFCRERLANYKVPKHFQIVADLPRTPTGKVLKRMLSAKA
jgi:long-chain acyl-CoA synthetase